MPDTLGPTMALAQYPSRPTGTDDLVRRLRSDDTDPKEKNALIALAKRMIEIFQEKRRLSHVPEAAALAPATTASSYQDLSRAFGNAVIDGTADGNILDPQLLPAFVSVLRCAGGDKTADLELGRVMRSLQTRLTAAVEEAHPGSQYRLIGTLSSVLDALIDTKTTGLSREELHEPLLKQLETLSGKRELRLAQAARYAHQALLGIPNDEGPYKALWRNMQPVVTGFAQVAGAVPAMDPAKLFDGLTELGGLDPPALVSSMVDVVKALSGLVDSVGGAAEGVKLRQKQKSWYVALRFTDMLLGARAFNYLEEFVGKVPCRHEKEFLCGLYAQLERAWEAGDSLAKQQVVQLLEQILVPAGCKSAHPRVREWVKLVADTLGRPDWRANVRPAPKCWWRKKEYTSSIPSEGTSDDTLSANLLEKAWKSCPEAQVFYADIEVWKRYPENDKLKVERLSGDRLPMDQCYINLAIVEQRSEKESRAEKGDTQQSSPFSRDARLKIQTPNKDVHVELPALFNPRKGPDDRAIHPRRILIRGRAGVGKTTLCKKIVHDFLSPHRMWKDQFDRILWVPLRNLKTLPEGGYTLDGLFSREYFPPDPTGRDLAHQLSVALRAAKYKRTLFILDGLDEVSEGLDETNKMYKLLEAILTLPAVIITSRPHIALPPWLRQRSDPTLDPNGLDLELETIGFQPDQVTAYVEKAFPNPATGKPDSEKVHKVLSFLQQHQLVQGLVRIPIQLDALCYTWNDFHGQTDVETMTDIYQAIEQKLWKKDTERLGRLSQQRAKDAFPKEIHNYVKDEILLLELLAFTGMHNDVVEFEGKHLEVIFQPIQADTNLPLRERLSRLSFLRMSDHLSKDGNYHFLHLTFQEYFAARYFIRQWNDTQPLKCLAFGGEDQVCKPAEFLTRHKYNDRYDIFWRFVAGLLSDKKKFFQMLEEEPRDILGPVHQRLVMHCLSEVAPSQDTEEFRKFRQDFEDKLKLWLLFECNLEYHSQLAAEMEFPERILEDVLKQELKTEFMDSLRARPRITPAIAKLAAQGLGVNVSQSLKITTLRMFECHYEALLDEILRDVAACLKDDKWDVRWAAVKVLCCRSGLPDEILRDVAACLKDDESDVRRAAVEVLGGRSGLPDEILRDVAACLKDDNSYVRRAAVEVLGGRAGLPDEILRDVAAYLKDDESYVRRAAVEVLGDRASLPDEILRDVAACLKDDKSDVRQAAVEVLRRRLDLPDEILRDVAACLKDDNSYIRRAAVEVLGGRSGLPDEIFRDVAACLKDDESYVRWAAVEVLRRRAGLPDEILRDVAACLKDDKWYVRRTAVQVLGDRLGLPDEILRDVAACLKDDESYVRWPAVQVLRHRAGLPDEILRDVVACLKDDKSDVRQDAVKVLGGRSGLPDEILRDMAAYLKDDESYVRRAAVEVLRCRAGLPDEILRDVVACLKDDDSDVRRAAVEVLGDRASLPDEILRDVVAYLKDDKSYVRRAAVQVLGGQAGLPDEILRDVVACLKDDKSDVRWAVVKVLCLRAGLPDEILRDVVACLKDDHRFVRRAVIEVQGVRAGLPDEILRDVAACLKDDESYVRRHAIEVLGGRAGLSDEILRDVAACLKDDESYVRRAAIKVLGGRAGLPDEILRDVAAYLKDDNWDVKWAAVEVLGRRAGLPDEILRDVAVYLKDDESDVRRAVVEILGGRSALLNKGFHSLLLNMDDQSFNSLFEFWLGRSFGTYLTWCVEGESSGIDMAGVSAPLPFSNQLKSRVKGARASLERKYRRLPSIPCL